MARQTDSSRPVAISNLPPLKSAVEIAYHAGPPQFSIEYYASRIVLRDASYDYLDALRSAAGDIVSGWSLMGAETYLLWGQDKVLYRYKIVIDEVLDPLPALRVVYLEPPQRHNRRHEWRSNTKLMGKIAVVTDQADASEIKPYPTITRNISYSALQCFVRHPLPLGTRLRAEWQLDHGMTLQHSMTVLRIVPGITQYRGVEGHDIVACWDPSLDDDAKQRWVTLCNQHRYE